MGVMPWMKAVKDSKQLTVFATDNVTKGSWNAIFIKALAEFNRLSKAHSLGVTLVQSTTPPDPKRQLGANIQFDTASGTITIKDQFVDDSIAFSGTALHGFTRAIGMQFGQQPAEMVRAYVFVPSDPKIQGVTEKFEPGPVRPVGDGIKTFIAVHEFIHAASGLNNSDHSRCDSPDVFVGPPICTPSASGSRNPNDDKIIVGTHPRISKFPPITLTPRTVSLIQSAWT